jgi:hypothetical protein
MVPGGRVLVAASRAGHDEPNGYLMNQSGDVEQVFTFGDCVADVLISSEHEKKRGA